MTQTPILWCIRCDADNKIIPHHPALLLQCLSHGSIGCLLCFPCSALLNNLQNDQLICALETQTEVVRVDFVLFVLCDNLESGCGLSACLPVLLTLLT